VGLGVGVDVWKVDPMDNRVPIVHFKPSPRLPLRLPSNGAKPQPPPLNLPTRNTSRTPHYSRSLTPKTMSPIFRRVAEGDKMVGEDDQLDNWDYINDVRRWRDLGSKL
jgi:hypothetical protein